VCKRRVCVCYQFSAVCAFLVHFISFDEGASLAASNCFCVRVVHKVSALEQEQSCVAAHLAVSLSLVGFNKNGKWCYTGSYCCTSSEGCVDLVLACDFVYDSFRCVLFCVF